MSEAQLLLGLFLWARRVSPDEAMEERTDTTSEAWWRACLAVGPVLSARSGRRALPGLFWADLDLSVQAAGWRCRKGEGSDCAGPGRLVPMACLRAAGRACPGETSWLVLPE